MANEFFGEPIGAVEEQVASGDSPFFGKPIEPTGDVLPFFGRPIEQPQETGDFFGEVIEDTTALGKLKDTALKIGEALNFVNAGAWAGVGALFGDESWQTLYRKYQEEGSPVSEAARKAVQSLGVNNKYAIAVAGFIADVLGDPLTYTGFGALTKTGKAAKIAKGASNITGSSRKIARLNARLAQMIPQTRKLAPTLAEQAKLGQRAFVQFAGMPVIRGEKLLSKIDFVTDKVRPATHLFRSGNKIKDRQAREIFQEALREERNLKGYFQDLLEDRIALFNKAAGDMPEETQRLVTRITENPEMFAKAKAGDFGDAGKFAVSFDNLIQLNKGLRENAPDALTAIGAENLAGLWDRTVPILGERALQREVDAVISAASKIEDDFAKTVAKKTNAKSKRINKQFDNMISKGESRDIVEPRRQQALDDLLLEHEEALSTKLDESKKYFYVQARIDALEESAKKMPRYIPHVVPKEAKGAFKKQAAISSIHGESVGDEIARKLLNAEGLPTYSIDDINRFASMSYEDLLKEGIPKQTAGKIVTVMKKRDEFFREPSISNWVKKRPKEADEFFSTNPGFIAKTQAQRTARAIGGARFRKVIGEGLGKSADDIAQNPHLYGDWKQVEKWKNLPEGKLFFSPEVADEINKVEKAYISDEFTNRFIDVFDRVQNYWKAWTLAPFPGFHNRNLAGAVWNNMLAGQYNPKYYGLAGQLQKGSAMLSKGLRKEGEEFLRKIKLGNGMDGLEALTLARQNGIRGEALYDAELITGLKPTKNIISDQGPIVRKGRKIGSAIEDNVRLSHFLHRLDEGYDAAEAAKSVSKYQFDYGDLTAFEKNFMARVMPFYRFTRFNLPLQVATLAESPGKIAAMEKFRRQVNNAQDLESYKEAFLSDYLGANFPIQLGTKKVGDKELPRLFAMGAWTPTQTALQNIGHPVEQIVSMVTPILKMPFEQWTNFDYFRKRPIVDVKRGRFTEPFANIPIPSRARHVVKNIRMLNEADRMLGSLITTISPESSNYVLRSGFKPDVADHVARYVTGVTLSPFDATEARTFKLLALKKDFMELMGGYRSAVRRKDDANAEATLSRILEKRKEIADVVSLTQNIGPQQ